MNKPLISWNEILHKRGLLDNRKRYLVATAMKQLPRVDNAMRDILVIILAGQLNLSTDLPQKELIKNIQERQDKIRYEVPHKPGIAFVIMTLWADARREAINLISKEVTDRRLAFFAPKWTWSDSAKGCPSDSPLDQLLEKNSASRAILAKLHKLKSGNQYTEDDFELALLWLSCQIVTAPLSNELSSAHSFTKIQINRSNARKVSEGSSNLDGEATTIIESINVREQYMSDSTSQTMDDLNVEQYRNSESEGVPNEVSLYESASDRDIIQQAIQEETQNSSLSVLRTAIEGSVHNTLNERKLQTLEYLKSLHTAVAAGELGDTKERFKLVQEAIGIFWDEADQLRNNCRQAISKLKSEFDDRPELVFALPEEIALEVKETEELVRLATTVLDECTKLDEYDTQHNSKQELYTKSLSELLDMEDASRSWLKNAVDDVLGTAPTIHEPTVNSFLSEFDLAFKSIRARQNYIQNHIDRAKETILRQIADAQKNLEAFNILANSVVAGQFVASDLKSDVLADLPPSKLFEIRDSLFQLMSEWQLRNHSTPIQRLSASLTQSWDEMQWYELVVNLCKEGRDLELLLMLVDDSHAEKSRNQKKLTHDLVAGLESAVLQVMKVQEFPQFWNYALPIMLPQWEPSDVMAKMKLGIAAICAHRLCTPTLPVSWGWEVTYEWPVTDMPTWTKLWQFFLLETPFSFSRDDAVTKLESDIRDAQQQASNIFIQENGQYVRARQLKHGRIVKVLSQKFMPEMESYLAKFREYEQVLRTTTVEQRDSSLTKVINYCAEIATLDESFLAAKFDIMLEEEQVWEPEGFHRRTLSNLFTVISQSLSHYADVFKGFAVEFLQDANTIDAGRLQNELSLYFAPSSIEQQLLSYLVTPSTVAIPSSIVQVQTLIEKACLSQSSFLMRCPRTAASLVHESISLSTALWSKLIHHLIEDLANPSDSLDTCVATLLGLNATKQILFLDGQVNRTQYEEAVRKSDHHERKINNLYKELIEIGGEFPQFVEYRDDGRWSLVEREISQKISDLSAVREKAKYDREQRLKQLNKQLSELDDQMFEMRRSIPHEGNEMLADAFAMARRALRSLDEIQDNNLEVVEEFYLETNYQFIHNSWALNKIHDIVSRLNQGFTKQPKLAIPSRTTKHILDLFERHELVALGLSSRTFESSKKSTREPLLANFISLKELKPIIPSSLETVQINRILTLFQGFARMAKMKSVRDMKGEPVINREGLFWGVYELETPKTPFLETHCILTILPGSPIKSSSIDQLETVIDEKELLSDRFIILFAPGCTQQIRSRLETRYPNSGLVIIDDATMCELVLAEADERNPVGCLRSLMLNARGATEVDIFTVNQLVTPRSAIFVGRDRWIDRLVKSSENFALYGGRRIGKSSILKVVEEKLLDQGNVLTKLVSCEGNSDYQDHAFARRLARDLKLHREVSSVEDFAECIEEHLELYPTGKIVILLDEIDRYITSNRTSGRHLMIETFRKLSDHHGERFRVVFAGFVELDACLRGRGPYTPSSDPWRRMIKDEGPLGNLEAEQAEQIVHEGFREILGWKYAHARIPQLIVERTGGHPAFVQEFCDKLQKRVAKRGDKLIRFDDLNAVFDDSTGQAFIEYVGQTLGLNLNSVARFLILSLVSYEQEVRTFTREQIEEYAMLVNDGAVHVTEELFDKSIGRLKVTSVIHETRKHVYEFTVPEYPLILSRLGEIRQLDNLVKKIRENPNDEHDNT